MAYRILVIEDNPENLELIRYLVAAFGHEPLLARKRKLRELLTFEGPIRYTPHRRKGGEDYFAEACGKGWEGLIAKRADAAYATGRTDRWLKRLNITRNLRGSRAWRPAADNRIIY